MSDSLSSRASLLLLIAALHAALLWAAVVRLHPDTVTPPQPLPVIMAQLLPQAPAPVAPPAPQPEPKPQRKPIPEPTPAPKPVSKPSPQPAPKPEPRTAPSEKALSTPKPVEPVERSPEPAPAVAPAPPAPPAPPVAAAPVPVTPPRFNAAYLNNPPPVYPPLLRRAGEEGKVMLRVFVTADGNPGEIRVIASSGNPLFDEAALNAVRKYRFVPARRGDTPVAEWVQVPIEFRLN